MTAPWRTSKCWLAVRCQWSARVNADAVTAVKMGLDMPRLTYPSHNESFEQVITEDVLNLESGGLDSSHYEGVWGLC